MAILRVSLGVRLVESLKEPLAFLSKQAQRSSPLPLVLMLALVGSPLLAHSQQQQNGSAVQPSFMDLIDHWPSPWATIPFYGLRLWDTHTFWAEINPAQGVYDWSDVDMWLGVHKQKHVDLLFTLGMTPAWAVRFINPGCHDGVGECDPPDDVNADGSGTDQHWQDFVTAIAKHVGTEVNYWEIWNEPNNPPYWSGTYAQLARMARDARSIILSVNPNAKLLNPGTSSHYSAGLNWWNGYAAAGGLQWADIIAVHGDVRPSVVACGDYPEPETFLTVMQNLHTVLMQYGQDNKPIWDTEASWGRTDGDCFTDQDLQAAFLGRFYLLHLSLGVQRFYWRGWIDGNGGLYNPQTGLNKAGVAYEQVHKWLIGSTMTQACATQGSSTTWTCAFTRPDGYEAVAVWDTSQSCKGSVCTTIPYQVGSPYVDYLTLDGSKIRITNGTVPIGAKPIWVEN